MPIHYRYSAILNIVFVTFMYGIALPVLFPIACLFMLNTYIAERLQLARFFKQPPLYDDRLSRRALLQIQYAPAFMMTLGYWFLSNQQMFFNKVETKRYESQVIDPQHSYFSSGNHLYPVFVFIAVFWGKKPCAVGARYIAGKFSFIIDY